MLSARMQEVRGQAYMRTPIEDAIRKILPNLDFSNKHALAEQIKSNLRKIIDEDEGVHAQSLDCATDRRRLKRYLGVSK